MAEQHHFVTISLICCVCSLTCRLEAIAQSITKYMDASIVNHACQSETPFHEYDDRGCRVNNDSDGCTSMPVFLEVTETSPARRRGPNRAKRSFDSAAAEDAAAPSESKSWRHSCLIEGRNENRLDDESRLRASDIESQEYPGLLQFENESSSSSSIGELQVLHRGVVVWDDTLEVHVNRTRWEELKQVHQALYDLRELQNLVSVKTEEKDEEIDMAKNMLSRCGDSTRAVSICVFDY